MKFRIVHDVNVAADKYWQYLFDPALEASVAKATNLAEFRVMESGDQGGVFVRKVHVIPDVVLPGPLKKLLGDSVGYTETDRAPQGGMQYDWVAIPDAIADKARISGVFKIEAAGEDRSRRTIEGEVEVKIFGIGKLAEKFVIDELEKNYAKVAREQGRWIAEKVAAGG